MNKTTVTTALEKELTNSYLTYAINIITDRAIPDVRDGLKPVHRRILYAMLKIDNKNSYKKSARVVGEVIGKYHPHGDTAVYESIVKMVQQFSLRYPLLDGQGNFGSIDDDPAAAMRYTEIKISKIAEKMLSNIEQDTVSLVPNYDNTCKQPEVLPTQVPNLLINGTNGIAVGIVTTFIPHNIIEVTDAIIAFLNNHNINIDNLLNIIKGPDFPTGGIVTNTIVLKNIYTTGKGTVKIQTKYHIEKYNKHESIILTELPYQVHKTLIISNIIKLISLKKIKGISNIKDESSKDGIRIKIDCDNKINTNLIIKQLFLKVPLEVNYQITTIALVNNKPKLLNLKEIIIHFVEHRVCIISKYLLFNLQKLKEKMFFFIGFLVAVDNGQYILKIIKKAKKKKDLKKILLEKEFNIPEIVLTDKNYIEYYEKSNNNKCKLKMMQVNAILEMKLSNLTNIEKKKIISQLIQNNEVIKNYKNLLKDEKSIKKIIIDEMLYLKKNFGDSRKTTILQEIIDENISVEKFEEKNIFLTITTYNHVKIYFLTSKDKEKIQESIKINTNIQYKHIYYGTTYSRLLIFTSLGKIYIIPIFVLLQNSIEKNTDINLETIIKLKKNELIEKLLIYNKNTLNEYIIISTKNGYIKKINLSIIENIKTKKLSIIKLQENDTISDAIITLKNDKYVFLVINKNTIIKLHNTNIKETKKLTKGTFVIKKNRNNINNLTITLIAAAAEKDTILIVTRNGFIQIINEEAFKDIKNKNCIFYMKQHSKIIYIKRILNNQKELLLLTENSSFITTTSITTQILKNKINILGNNKKLVCVELI